MFEKNTGLMIVIALYSAWISEMMAIITAMEFPRDLQGAETGMERWKEHRAEVDSRKDAVSRFKETGQAMIHDKHFLSDEVCLDWVKIEEILEIIIRTFAIHLIII